MQRLKKLYYKFKYHGPGIWLASFFWFLFRTGTRPTRFVYPCQRTALSNILLFSPLVLSSLALKLRRRARLYLVLLLAFSGVVGVIGGRWGIKLYRSWRAPARTSRLQLWPQVAQAAPASNLFVVQNVPPSASGPEDEGVDALVNLMGEHNLDFYQMIGKDDVVVIKINGQWPNRGHTNTDLLRGVINKIVTRPDGFTGEVIVADNTQFVETDLNWNPANAEDTGNTITKIVEDFAAQGHKVSIYLWRLIGGDFSTTYCSDYDGGDEQDCYICDSANEVTYPKFTTSFGTKISMRKGIWDGSGFDNSRLKFINLPVLKRHNGYGVTSALKNFVGFLSKQCHSGDFHTQIASERAILAREMVYGRMPDLHIIDAIYTSANMGPDVGWHDNRAGVILASKDPVALDYYAAKYVLNPISGAPETDPNGNNIFNRYLTYSRDYFNSHGYTTTMNEAEMNVYVYDFEGGGSTPTGEPTAQPTGQPTAQPTSPPPTVTGGVTPAPTVPITCPVNGDYNGDGTIDTADYEAWRVDYVGGTASLSCFEYWRRASFVLDGPTPTGGQQPTPTVTSTPGGSGKLKYYGVETVFDVADFATLQELGINTVVANISVGNTLALQQHYDAAQQYDMKIIIWPLGGGNCGFPWSGSGTSWDITAAHDMLDFMATHEDRFIAITIAHEPQWSCQMSNEEMETIRQEIKDYVQQKHGKDIKITNKINGVVDDWTGGVTDIAEIWMHCTTGGGGGSGAEGDCQTALDGSDPYGRSAKQARETIERNGWDWELIFQFESFGMAGMYTMPSAAEMREWGCKFAQSGYLDGFIWYTWDPESGGYSEYLHGNRYDAAGEDRWEAMRYVKENCIE